MLLNLGGLGCLQRQGGKTNWWLNQSLRIEILECDWWCPDNVCVVMWDTRRIHRCWILFWRMPHSRELSWLKDNICAYMGIWRWFTECKVRVVKTHSANNALSPAVRRKGDGNWTKILNRHLRLHNQCSQCALCLQFYCSVIVVTWVHWQRMIRCYQSEEIRWRPKSNQWRSMPKLLNDTER